MKPKDSPTSPKAKNKKQADDISKFYEDSLKTIEKPKKTHPFTTILLLLVIIIVGFFAGMVGQIVLLSYGAEIPIINKFEIFSSFDQSALVLTRQNKDKSLTAEQVESIAAELSETTVQIFQKKSSEERAEPLYYPEESIGDGFILTDDGYIVSHSDSIDEQVEYVVMTYDGKVFAANIETSDTATDFVILKINNSNLSTVGIADIREIYTSEEIIAIDQFVSNSEPVVLKTSVLAPHYFSLNEKNNIVSSEKYNELILLGNEIPSRFIYTIVYTFDKKALGIIVKQDGDYKVLPFDYLDPVMEQVLSGEEIQRPYLGINYFNLSLSSISPVELTEEIEDGALIYSNDDNILGVLAGSPAEESGLKDSDVLTELDGVSINGQNNLTDLILSKKSGDTITLTKISEGITGKISIILD